MATVRRVEQERLKPKRNIRNTSKDQERKIAELYKQSGFPNARRVPGSGAFATLPGDINPGEMLLVEAKQTRMGRQTINPEWVKKARLDANELGRVWFSIHVWVAEGDKPYEKIVVLEEATFMQLMARLRAAEAELQTRE